MFSRKRHPPASPLHRAEAGHSGARRPLGSVERDHRHPCPGGPYADAGGLARPPPGAKKSPARPHTPQLPTSPSSGPSTPQTGRGRHAGEGERGTEAAEPGAPAPAPRAGWTDAATHPGARRATGISRLGFSGRRPEPPRPPRRGGAGKASPEARRLGGPPRKGTRTGRGGQWGASGARCAPEGRRRRRPPRAAREPRGPRGPRRPPRSGSCLTSQPRRPGEQQN